MKRIFPFLFIFLTAAGLFAQAKSDSKSLSAKNLKTLYRQMTGYYSSGEQAAADSAYFDIRLKMVPMWKERGEYWLYVEQAMAGKEDKPYRQRVYQLVLLDEFTIESRVYTIPGGEKYFGEWQKKSPLATLTPDSLELRKGCSIHLNTSDGTQWEGSTVDKNCESNLRGASYATSEVKISKGLLASWDRGFDKSDKQVWGAEKGAYLFRKIKKP